MCLWNDWVAKQFLNYETRIKKIWVLKMLEKSRRKTRMFVVFIWWLWIDTIFNFQWIKTISTELRSIKSENVFHYLSLRV